MTCKDCLHYEACKGTYYTAKGCDNIALYDFDGEMYADSGCEDFTDRSEWVHLPCKVGDKVYYLRRNPKTLEWHIQETKVYTIDIRHDGPYIYVNHGFNCYAPKQIGKQLFLTRKEAEKALEEKK